MVAPDRAGILACGPWRRGARLANGPLAKTRRQGCQLYQDLCTGFSYLTARPSKNAFIARYQQATQDWWQHRRQDFDLFTSLLVINEASVGDQQMAQQRLQVLATIPLVGLKQEALDLAHQLIGRGPLPAKAADDALHIALAAVHGIDYLLTWNCKHIANAELRQPLIRICSAAGFTAPVACTPEELMGL